MPVYNLSHSADAHYANATWTYHRPLERLSVFLKPLERLCLIRRAPHNASRNPGAKVFEDVLELVAGRRGLSHIELEFVSLGLILCAVARRLVFRRMRYCGGVRLLEDGEGAS